MPPSLPLAVVQKDMFEGDLLFFGELSPEDGLRRQTVDQNFQAGAAPA